MLGRIFPCSLAVESSLDEIGSYTSVELEAVEEDGSDQRYAE